MNTITKILIVAVIGIVILFTNVLSFNGDNLVLQFPSIQFFLEFLASLFYYENESTHSNKKSYDWNRIHISKNII